MVISSGKPSRVPRIRCICVISSIRASSLSLRFLVSLLPSIFCRKNDSFHCNFIHFVFYCPILVHNPTHHFVKYKRASVRSSPLGRGGLGAASRPSHPKNRRVLTFFSRCIDTPCAQKTVHALTQPAKNERTLVPPYGCHRYPPRVTTREPS